ncbi:MAG: ATP-binding cassette domain-containing protein [Coriobacteriia bacterium]|nr:ATP-binding cassette domain-containing protein [Coriobacteriia bacterium]
MSAEQESVAFETAGLERPPIVEVRGLVKRYGDFTAVDGVSFEIAENSCFGLLGPNGAGKTTTISMLSCLIAPDEGDILVDGHSVRTDSHGVRRVLGIVPQEIALYPTLTAAENLRFWGKMYGLSGKALADAVEYGLMMAGLEDRAKDRVETFSGGMKRRINIAAGILHRPRVLLMDEPTVGIDPQSRNHILDTVRELNRAGMTVLYTSHYMEEVEALCDDIAIVDHGKVIATGSQEELRALVGDEDRIRVKVGDALDSPGDDASEAEAAVENAKGPQPDPADDEPIPPAPEVEAALAALRALPGVSRADALAGAIEVLAPDAAGVLGDVVSAIVEAGADIRAIEIVEPDLESVFLHLTGRGLRD